MRVPPVEVLEYFLLVCDVFGKHRVFRSKFFTQEFWSSQYENDRELHRTVLIRFSISEEELQRDYLWLDSGLPGEHKVRPGIFFGNAECGESDEVFLLTGDVYSETDYTLLDFETPPELFTEALWNAHREWFEERAI